jgi:hypothetical protein
MRPRQATDADSLYDFQIGLYRHDTPRQHLYINPEVSESQCKLMSLALEATAHRVGVLRDHHQDTRHMNRTARCMGSFRNQPALMGVLA